MLINFNNLSEVNIKSMNGGLGNVAAKMFKNEFGKVILSRIPPNSSIGMHMQKTSNDINFIVKGKGKAICNGNIEDLSPGVCHYCPKGSEHSIINTGNEDLIIFTVVQEL